MPKGGKKGRGGPRIHSRGGSTYYGGNGYRLGGSSGGASRSSYGPTDPDLVYTGYGLPVYSQKAMDALQANIAKAGSVPYGGHPLQQQRPDLQARTVETRWSERGQYGQDHTADRYLEQHSLAENLGGQVSDALQQTYDQRRGK